MDIKVSVTIGLNDTTLEVFNRIANALENKKPTQKAVDAPAKADAAPAATTPKVDAPAPKKAEAPEAKAETKNITIDDVRQAFASAKRAGKPTADIKAILTKYGASVVSDLKAEHYPAVIDAIAKLYF